MPTCPQCDSVFSLKGKRARAYCSPPCQKAAANARNNRLRNPSSASAAIFALQDVKMASGVVSAPPDEPLATIEWLNVFDDLHRAVAGRLNRTRGRNSIRREDAIGMDRQPIGHAVFVDGEWRGKVRSNGAVIWVSEQLGSLEDAKRAVEAQLSPEIVASAANLNRAAPVAIAA